MSGSIYSTVPNPNALLDPNAAPASTSIYGASTTPAAPNGQVTANALAPPGTAQLQQPAPPQSMSDYLNTWANQQNANAYGTSDPMRLVATSGMGFPFFQNPAAIQGHLADIIQGTAPLPQGQTMQAVQDEWTRQMAQANNNRGAGGTG